MKRSTSHKLRRIGSKALIVSIDASNVNLAEVHTLNDTAAALWERIGDDEISLPALAQWLCDNYEIDFDSALADVQKIIAEWQKYRLITEK